MPVDWGKLGLDAPTYALPQSPPTVRANPLFVEIAE